MFSKFVIRNVGVLRGFATPDAPKLAPLTLFYGRNGRGKSTLTAVLSAARDGSSNAVLARQSLGNGGAAPDVSLISASGTVRFAKGFWHPKNVPLEVFDTTFITDNIYAGDLTELVHDRGLFSIIIGKDGVRLANQLERFNAIAKAAAARLKSAEAALADDLPSDLTKREFIALAQNIDYSKRLEDAERALKAVQQADRIAALKPLEELTMPALPADMTRILASTLTDISSSARERLLDHFKRFGFDKKGEAWINYGVDHVADEVCPFCGREDVDAKGMVTLYGQIFSENYKTHLANIIKLGAATDEHLGEDVRDAVAARLDANSEARRRWAEYVTIERELPEMADFVPLLAEAHQIAKSLCERKRTSPTEPITAELEVSRIKATLASARSLLDDYNAAVNAINTATARPSTTPPTTVDAAAAVRDIRKRLARHDPGVEKRVQEYRAAHHRDERARRVRTAIQKRLKKANEDASQHYHERVNHYLNRFGASFAISKITNSMQGNAGQAGYGLLIKGETVARGRGRQADAVPSFRNTLSAGDKSTLALAFFLAKLDRDEELTGKTIVIDGPLSSHDSHRRLTTIEAIKELCGRCSQVIVLSHDEFLLHAIERRCSEVKSVAFQIEFAGGDGWSQVKVADLDLLCRADHVKMVAELAAFVERREGAPDDVVLKVRQALETHYRRSYSAWFGQDQNLGAIIKSISEEGASHPAFRDLTKLDFCNAATCDKHHGDNAAVIVKRGIEPEELSVIVSDALQLVGARRPEEGPYVATTRSGVP